jgi:hypothetical protein
MGLDMRSKQKICGEIFRRYQKTDKKSKDRLLDEYAEPLGYNRDYLAHLLTNWGNVLCGGGREISQICRKRRSTGPLKRSRG